MINLMHGDCLEMMRQIPDGSVDMVLTDPPYGTVTKMGNSNSVKHGMKNKVDWDVKIDIKEMFAECERVTRTGGNIILFSQEPYTSQIITSAHFNVPFCYRMVWIKDHFANSLIAKVAPVNYYEDIVVFYRQYDRLLSNPLRKYSQKLFAYIGKTKKDLFDEMGNQSACHFMRFDSMQFSICTLSCYQQLIEMYKIHKMDGFLTYEEMAAISIKFNKVFNLPEDKKFKSNVLSYKKDYEGLHPTQKPVALMEDLIKTYTNEGETVLDFTMGSGTTGVAAKNLNRSFIGIELDESYFNIAKERIENSNPLGKFMQDEEKKD
jgi:site-specific DNA-methyltransferase (adenine-specific)